MNAYDILIKQRRSEKAYSGYAVKKYTFIVHPKATKTQIKAAVEAAFEGVKVEKVNTVNVRGKYKRQGRSEGYTSSFKKAYVQLTDDSKAINEFEA